MTARPQVDPPVDSTAADHGAALAGGAVANVRSRPILFSGPMVRALLDGRKTQTRRAMKPQPPEWCRLFGYTCFTPPGHIGGRGRVIDDSGEPNSGEKFFRCPYGSAGERLWVRETWHPAIAVRAFYQATDEKLLRDDGWTGKWRPSIHMPRSASRLTLRITSIRVERLQQISEQDAIAEGVERDEQGWKLYVPGLSGVIECKDARTSYRTLWNSINGVGSWERDPWVWVLAFERVAA